MAQFPWLKWCMAAKCQLRLQRDGSTAGADPGFGSEGGGGGGASYSGKGYAHPIKGVLALTANELT